MTRDAARELGLPVPRAVAGLSESTGWSPVTPRGVRQFGEVMLDEVALKVFSLLGGSPAAIRRAVSEVRAVVRWLQPDATAVAVAGISMDG